MEGLTPFQAYLSSRIESYEKMDQYGMSVYTWFTLLSQEDVFNEIKEIKESSEFYNVPSLQFESACIWCNENLRILISWRKIQSVQKNIVVVYKFDSLLRFKIELDALIANPDLWLESFY